MKSIGNDIVDLNFINKERTLQPAFYSKFLSFSERSFQSNPLISNESQIKHTWLLWSAKEAVYKFAKRRQPELIFSPGKIILGSEFTELSEPEFSESENFQNSDIGLPSGSFLNSGNSDPGILLNFTFQNKTYYTRSTITSDYIATIANDVPDFSDFETGVKKIGQSNYQSQSAEVRNFLLARLATLFPAQSFKIGKSQIGYPVIGSSQPDTGIIASFAHHGYYIAYAYKPV